jgi:N-carbamoylputrescine amidase
MRPDTGSQRGSDGRVDPGDQKGEYRPSDEFIEDAGKQGVQILCFQEIFTRHISVRSSRTRWYEAVEKIPMGRRSS